jgi:RimJ/RimL family protein N-acetyltransferase
VTVRVRRVARDDLPAIRDLRNRNRSWFFDDREVTAEQHEAWFASLKERAVDFYVIEVDERVAGTISLARRGDDIEVGNLILDDEYRGRGLMTQAIEQLCTAPGKYFAHVKPGNDASARVFDRAGFDRTLYFERTQA